MKKKLFNLSIILMLLCILTLPVMAAGCTDMPVSAALVPAPVSDSVTVINTAEAVSEATDSDWQGVFVSIAPWVFALVLSVLSVVLKNKLSAKAHESDEVKGMSQELSEATLAVIKCIQDGATGPEIEDAIKEVGDVINRLKDWIPTDPTDTS